MEVTLGGNRVGSGQKMKAHLHNYNRSTHNLSEKFASSAASGVLYPCLCKLAMRGDTFDININADARTIPTKGPLFGSYKMQIDVYQCPLRLYQGLLHNNPQAIGLNMAQIKFPIIKVKSYHDSAANGSNSDEGEFTKSCLLKYLGMSGLGTPKIAQSGGFIGRNINALPLLSYYDIYKTYYANKQEEKGYIISGAETSIQMPYIDYYTHGIGQEKYEPETYNMPMSVSVVTTNGFYCYIVLKEGRDFTQAQLESQGCKFIDPLSGSYEYYTLAEIAEDYGTVEKSIMQIGTEKRNVIFIGINAADMATIANNIGEDVTELMFGVPQHYIETDYNQKLVIKDFPLANIDDMRYKLLSAHTLGSAFQLGLITDVSGDTWNEQEGTSEDGLPYSANFMITKLNEVADTGKLTYNHLFPMNGLALKTYQNDIYNNWLNTEWIEGENGINEMTKVEVDEHGAFSMDSLNFAQKLYNMLNRIAVAGNTYEDWQDVVYEEVQRRQIESPMYCGGFSQEIMFDEIVQTAPATIDGDTSELGTLGGRGRLVDGTRKGGNIHIKCDEACFIIAIVSLTPRIFYTQGNEFYMTDVFSMDDLHKPAMDGIGFQDLIGERLAWFNTTIDNAGADNYAIFHRSRIGKLPAWIEYMTSVDKAYGDFAENYGKGYMILNRNYESILATGASGSHVGAITSAIKDATTYIDPSKYNYAFAYTELEAQNFWLEIAFNIRARRLMSARLIPNV